MSGWIAVERDIFGETIFPKEPMSEREAYLWLKANAAWEDTTHRVGSEVLPCPRGSLFITLRDFQTTTSWGSDKKIRGFLLRLQEAGLIRAEARGKRNARKTHITICNYDIKEYSGRTEDASKTHRGRTEDAVKEEGRRKKIEDTDVSSLSSSDDSPPDLQKILTCNCAGPKPRPVDDISAAVSAYNVAAEQSGWPKVQKLSQARRSALAARLRDAGGIAGWDAALAKAQSSNHCCGVNDRGWTANFDFLTRQSSFTKLMEGNYDNRQGSRPNATTDTIARAAEARRSPGAYRG